MSHRHEVGFEPYHNGMMPSSLLPGHLSSLVDSLRPFLTDLSHAVVEP